MLAGWTERGEGMKGETHGPAAVFVAVSGDFDSAPVVVLQDAVGGPETLGLPHVAGLERAFGCVAAAVDGRADGWVGEGHVLVPDVEGHGCVVFGHVDVAGD